MGAQQRLGQIIWVQDLNGSAGTTAYPSASTAGVAPEDASPSIDANKTGTRVHVAVEYTVASGTTSCTVALLGYATTGSLSAGRWLYLGSMNGGTAMAANTSKWSPDTSTIRAAEVFTLSGEQFTRFKTRSIAPGGTSPLVSTYIGFERE